MAAKQLYKTVYFSDHPGNSAKRRSVTLAFGKRYTDVYDNVKGLSSAELRHLLGTELYGELVEKASGDELPLNTYCLRQISHSLKSLRENPSQLYLPNPQFAPHIFDPVTVTFKAGAKEPFGRWYSYLEGYSPQFVEAIINKYAENAYRILDPFAGTGTTAFAASKLGRDAVFCEINPVLQFVSLTKIQSRRLASARRFDLARRLESAAKQLTAIDQYEPDIELNRAYERVFGNSKFFDELTYQRVLRLRTWIDEVRLVEPLLADLLTISVISGLVPASKMKRAADLRYKTSQELINEHIDLVEYLAQKIPEIAADVSGDVNGLKNEPALICESAQSLAYIPNLEIDAVITSPPYVNGTNYFRNTKIELWFMRCLRAENDLASFRASAVTAGINDVTMANASRCEHPDVRAMVKKLEANAYDVRIPRMIDSYFAELTSVFQSVARHLASNAIVAIDIGDSSYGGVHVPVDELLSKCLQSIGFAQEDSVVLRERRSRGGEPLRQVLQVYRHIQPKPYYKIAHLNGTYWNNGWSDFKSDLPHQQEPFTKRNWGHPRHSICSYLGKLKPSIAYHLVKTFVPDGGKVLDPFAGVGTIPFEAALQSKESFSFDISPCAVVISSAKVQRIDAVKCKILINRLAGYISANQPTAEEMLEVDGLGFNGKIVEYYEKRTLREIVLARRFFKEWKPALPEEYFILASLLHILHGNRPYALSRRSHPITPYKPQGNFEYRSLIEKLNEKVERGLDEALPDNFKDGRVFLQDATGWWPREVNNLDAIVTSPPFFDSTRFYVANWLRLWFVGWSREDFRKRPLGFVDERQKKGFDVYASIFRQSRERLKPNGVLVLHLGKSEKCDMAAELSKLGEKWFRCADVFDESVSHCETHGVTDKGSVTSHQYLLLY